MSRAPARSRRTPIRMTGTLAALIISSLGVAAFSGPATCPCGDSETTAALKQPAAPSLTRFAYARTNVATAYRAVPQGEAVPDGEADLASVPIVPEGRSASIYETLQLADDDGEPVDASPISTAAIEPAAYRPRSAVARSGAAAHRLTKLTAEEAEPIRLASADPVELLPASSPAIEARTVELSDSAADIAVSEPKREPIAQQRSSHKHASAKHRTYRAYRSVVESRESKRKRLANIPPWAEKMFAPNWQSKAFEY